MIYGKLLNTAGEVRFLPQALHYALSYLKQCNFKVLENKRYDIDGDAMFMVVAEYETKALSEKKAEQHRDYIDLHYLISGQKKIGLGYNNNHNEVLCEYNKEKDCAQYSITQSEVYIPLIPGMFLILFSQEIHRPGLDFEGKQKIRKAVIKIKSSLLFD